MLHCFDFLQDIYDFFVNKWTEISEMPSKKRIHFWKFTLEYVGSYSLHVKSFIWIARCRKFNLSLNAFLSWFKLELKINQMSYGDNKRLSYLNNNAYKMEDILLL